MTATLSRPAAAEPARDQASVLPPRPRPASSSGSLLTAEVLLGLVTLVSVVSLARVYDGWYFLRSALPALVVGHLLTAALRRLRWPLAAAATASALVLVAMVPLLLYRDTTTWGLLPNTVTWHAVLDDLREAWDQFGVVKAPAEPLAGFLVATVVGAWLVAFLADTLAFRFAAVVEPLLPAGGLFVFAAALAADRHRVASGVALLVASAGFVLAQRGLQAERGPGWLGGQRGTNALILLRAGVGAVAVAALVAVVVGPRLPGAGKTALLDAYDGGGSSSRVTLSPLVDIRGRLTDQTDTEAFRVTSNVASYWRLTALDVFDGRLWKSSNSVDDADGILPGADTTVPTETVQQDFTITGLDVIWLPAAYRPVKVTGGDDVSFDERSGSLLTGSSSVAGQRYQIESAVPRPDAAALAATTSTLGSDDGREYLALPAAFPRNLRDLANDVTDDASNSYEQALALQQFFRDNFTYSLEVSPGHGDDAIEAFLERRAGYCEQFAGTFAALARAVGLPSRVAVGFTPGEAQADGSYLVRGRNAHAWPEVWFSGVGWVPFEPTPQRGIPGAESYTGVAPQQDTTVPTDTTATTVPTDTTLPVDPSLELGPDGFPLEDFGAGGDLAAGSDNASPWPGRFLAVLGVAALALVALVVAGPVRRQWLRRRRRARARSDADRVLVSWAEAEESLSRAGAPRGPSETPREYAGRAATMARVSSARLGELAEHATTAQYGEAYLTEDAAHRSTEAVTTIEADLARTAPWTTRLRRSLDPRTGRGSATSRWRISQVIRRRRS